LSTTLDIGWRLTARLQVRCPPPLAAQPFYETVRPTRESSRTSWRCWFGPFADAAPVRDWREARTARLRLPGLFGRTQTSGF
jgi:hypothetical protein